jgi:chromosome segregation ATPase
MRRFLPYLGLIPAIVAGGMWWSAESARRAAADRVTSLENELRQRSASPASPAPAESAPHPESSGANPRVVRVPTGTDPTQYLRTIDDLREQMQEQARELSASKDAAARAAAAAEAEAAERRKLAAQIDDLREDIQAARRLTDAVQAELKVKSDRLIKSETSERLLQDRATKAEAAASRVAGATREMEDLNRRREAYLTTLMRRYREVGDLYRNFTLNAQTAETPGNALQAGDLSRIQNAIQQAEDDLRQLQALNARVAQLARAK